MTDYPRPTLDEWHATPPELRERVRLARLLHRANLNGTPNGIAVSKWMSDVRPGDLVVEVTTGFYQPHIGKRLHVWKALGTLKEIRHDSLVDEDGNEYSKETVWIIETELGPVNWTNARFVRIPRDDHEESSMSDLGYRCTVFPDCPICARAVPSFDTRR